jgi:hypothetical protein
MWKTKAGGKRGQERKMVGEYGYFHVYACMEMS